ncbi:CHC2 zinc finger domain-containing protein [Arenicellales bacterium nBUS_45]
MSGKIPREFIDDVLARTDIVEVIGARISLSKGGRDFKGCCPFHNEKTPSFTVSQTKQFYHCFGCGANGSAIGFLMDFDQLSFSGSN